MLMTEAGEEGRRYRRVGDRRSLTWRWQAGVSVRETFGFR